MIYPLIRRLVIKGWVYQKKQPMGFDLMKAKAWSRDLNSANWFQTRVRGEET